jgi:cold shock protein
VLCVEARSGSRLTWSTCLEHLPTHSATGSASMPDRRESTLLLLCSLSPASALRLAVPTAGVVTRRSRTTPVVALVAGDTLLTGQCLWFNTDKGFGFINVDGDEEELFVHHRDIYAYGFQSLDEGEPVEFFCAEDAKGRKRATDVTGPNGTCASFLPRPTVL